MENVLKARVDAYGRMRMADKLGMKYPTLSNKLNGMNTLSDEEAARIIIELDAAGIPDPSEAKA